MEKSVKNTVKKTMAVMFSAILFAETILSAVPVDVSAEGGEGKTVTSNVITGFSPLPDDVKEQMVETGTKLEDLNLPTELEVTVEQTVEQNTPASPDIQESMKQSAGKVKKIVHRRKTVPSVYAKKKYTEKKIINSPQKIN